MVLLKNNFNFELFNTNKNKTYEVLLDNYIFFLISKFPEIFFTFSSSLKYKPLRIKQTKYILLTLFVLFSNFTKSQFYYFNTNEPIRLEVSFRKHSIEASSGKTIFNVLKVKNQTQQSQTFTLNLTVPAGWSVIGNDKQEITLAPLDSIYLPIRVAIGEKVRGDIGYSIIAALTDLKGNSIKNEYSFIKIPRETDLRVRVLTRMDYIDQQTGQSSFKIRAENRGNREEMINFLIESDNGLSITPARLKTFSQDINIQPYTDTIIDFDIFQTSKDLSKELSKISITAKTIDSVYHSTVWFRDLSSNFSNYISENKRALVAEFFSRGLFSNYSKPSYSSIIYGNLLFPKKREIYYYYNNDKSEEIEDFYRFNRMWIGFKNKNIDIKIGDINASIESSLHGRGADLILNLNKINLELIGSKGILYNSNNYGGVMRFNPSSKLSFHLGGTYNKTERNNVTSKIALLGTKFTIKNKHKILVQGSIDQIEFGKNPNLLFSKTAYGADLIYSSHLNHLTTNIRGKLGTRYYNSSYNGRAELYINNLYRFNNRSNLSFNFVNTKSHLGNFSIHPDTLQPFTSISKTQIIYGLNPKPKIYLFAGPGLEITSSDAFPQLKYGSKYFQTQAGSLNFGFKVNGATTNSSISSQAVLGLVKVSKYTNIFNGQVDSSFRKKPNFPFQYISFNLKQPKWGAQLMYTNGARSIYEQFNWFYGTRQTRMLRVMPYFDSYVYKNDVRLQINISYSNDLISKSSYVNFTTQLFWYLPKDWQLRLLNVYTIQSRTTPSEDIEKFQNIYFEFSIRKEFGIQQPNQKFYNLTLNFFKDYNGDRVMNDNEPGIKNVLVNIQRVDEGATEYSDFVSGELLSSQTGSVTYEKIPAGTYELTYNPVGKEAGTFSKSDIDLSIKLDKNQTINIPFVEKNKVFGKIVLYRSRLSGLGRIDISNVRITATDSRGRTYSTLTDKNGEFTIFAPVTDEYVVNINNIFYENFDLRQNNFKVQFNGYKQFEVNFVFDEKVRRINFSPSSQDAQLANVLQVRRTNLRGTIKDASSLNPIRARVNLVNTKNNSVLTSIYSSSQTGDYNLSFMADDNYLLEVLADGYWYHSENLNLNQVTTFLNITKDILLKPIAIGSKIELNIRFLINKTDLTAEAVAELNRLLQLLRANENIKIEIQGHSDDLEALNNPKISEERARVVARYLIENGFSNIQIRGFGNTVPIAPNDTEENRLLNRRVEVEVISK